MLRIFTSVKIQRLRPGLNLQTCVPEASMLTIRPPKLSHLGKRPVCSENKQKPNTLPGEWSVF